METASTEDSQRTEVANYDPYNPPLNINIALQQPRLKNARELISKGGRDVWILELRLCFAGVRLLC